jgi:hypothetical protein
LTHLTISEALGPPEKLMPSRAMIHPPILLAARYYTFRALVHPAIC